MKKPCDVKLTINEIYVLCYQESFCVHIFSYNGDILRSLITCGNGMQALKTLFFLLSPDENMIISDNWGQQILIISSEGRLLDKLGIMDSQVEMFRSPHGITLIDNRKLLVVSQYSDYSMHIFYTP